MADLTSLHRNKPKRDFSIQACADCINKIAIEFPSEFKEGFFTDYFDIEGGTQPPKSKFINEPRKGYVKFLQIRDFASESTPTFIPVSKTNKLCNENDLVLGRYGASVGKILTGKSGAYNVACAKIIFLSDNEINKDFLFYWLHSSYFQNSLTSISRSAQGGFNKNDLSRIKTLFPTIKMQIKLTAIMKSIDLALLADIKIELNKTSNSDIEKAFIKLIEKFLSFINEGEELSTELTNQLSLVKKLRQQLLQDAVQGKLVKQNEKDEPASVLLKRIKAEKEQPVKAGKLKNEKELPIIKEEDIPFDIPENWLWCRFSDIVKIESNLVSPFDFPNSPHIAPDNIEKNTGRLLPYRTVLEDSVQSANHHFYSGQLIYSKVRPQLNKVVKIDFEGLCSADMYPLRPLVNTDYIQQCMLSGYFLIEVGKFDNRVKMPKINQNQLSQIPLPLPPLAEQDRIVHKLNELLQYCNDLEASTKQSAKQNEKLLQQVLREALRG